MRFSFYGHMVCFLNCHLAAHMNYALQRVDELEHILEVQDFDMTDTPHIRDHKSVQLHTHHSAGGVYHGRWHDAPGSSEKGCLLLWWPKLSNYRPRSALHPLVHQQWTAESALEQRPGAAHTHTLTCVVAFPIAHYDEDKGTLPTGIQRGAAEF